MTLKNWPCLCTVRPIINNLMHHHPYTFATINLCNLGEWSDPQKIANFVYAMQHELNFPNIIAVQEIGGLATSPDTVVQATITTNILAQLNACSPMAYAYADRPPLPERSGGADAFNIRCGYFYQTPITLLTLTSIGFDHTAFTGDIALNYRASRLPLCACFSHKENTFWLINCHLKSMMKGQQTKQAVKKQRNAQAKIITDYIDAHLPADAAIIILGDFNDTPGSRTLAIFENKRFIPTHLSLATELYTYKHHKKPVILDYIMYNTPWQLKATTIIHLNTQPLSGCAFSDHDPVTATFYL